MSTRPNSGGVLSLRAADRFMTRFQQIFTAFCVLMTKICIFLFFSNLASKLHPLLITNTASKTEKSNRIQREFDSNGAIWTFDHEPSTPKNKLFQMIRFIGNAITLHCPSETNRIQREFLFNNCIQSQNAVPASSPPRQKTNFFKPNSLLHQRACECNGEFTASGFLHGGLNPRQMVDAVLFGIPLDVVNHRGKGIRDEEKGRRRFPRPSGLLYD
jgi:hypothetical protein